MGNLWIKSGEEFELYIETLKNERGHTQFVTKEE